MSSQNRILVCLLVMALFDILIPLPLAVLMLIYVLYARPVWFKRWVDTVYRL